MLDCQIILTIYKGIFSLIQCAFFPFDFPLNVKNIGALVSQKYLDLPQSFPQQLLDSATFPPNFFNILARFVHVGGHFLFFWAF